MKTLPEFYAIRRDESNPLWRKFKEWFDKQSGHRWTQKYEYWGWDNKWNMNGYDCWDSLKSFKNPVTLITLEDWNAAVNGSDNEPIEKETTEFDSNKPFEVSDDGLEWFNIKYAIDYDYKFEYITENNHIVLSHLVGGNRRLVIFPYMRNIPEQFNAGMLKVGESMVVESGLENYIGSVVRRTRYHMVKICVLETGEIIWCEEPEKVKGRRVNVKHIIEEV